MNIYLCNNSKKYHKAGLLKTCVCTGIISVFVAALPSARAVFEKYVQQDKIGKKVELNSAIDLFCKQLGYYENSHTLFCCSSDDIDLGHGFGSEQSMLSLLQQFHTIGDGDNHTNDDELKTVSALGNWTSYAFPYNQQRHRVLVEVQLNRTILEHISKKFRLEKREVIFLLSTLIDLGLTECIEDNQKQDESVQLLTQSGYNRIDFRGNVLGVLYALQHSSMRGITPERIVSIITTLQSYYTTVAAGNLLVALASDIGMKAKIVGGGEFPSPSIALYEENISQ